MKKITTIVMTVSMLTAMSCSEGSSLTTNTERGNVHLTKEESNDYTIQVVSPTKQITFAGQFDTSTYFDYTEVAGDSTIQFEWKYSDGNESRLVQDGTNSVRYIYGNVDTSYYSVRFTNLVFRNARLDLDLVIAGATVAHITALAADADNMPTSMDEMFVADDNPRGRLTKMLRNLIPPIDFSLGSNNTITINNGNGNVNGNGNNNYNGPGQPCTVSDAVVTACINAGISSARLCYLAGGKPSSFHGPCHDGCRFECK